MKTITKEKMTEALGLTAIEFNEFLMGLENAKILEDFLVKVLKYDRLKKSNGRIIKRIHSRLNKVRAMDERVMLASRRWYGANYI